MKIGEWKSINNANLKRIFYSMTAIIFIIGSYYLIFFSKLLSFDYSYFDSYLMGMIGAYTLISFFIGVLLLVTLIGSLQMLIIENSGYSRVYSIKNFNKGGTIAKKIGIADPDYDKIINIIINLMSENNIECQLKKKHKKLGTIYYLLFSLKEENYILKIKKVQLSLYPFDYRFTIIPNGPNTPPKGIMKIIDGIYYNKRNFYT